MLDAITHYVNTQESGESRYRSSTNSPRLPRERWPPGVRDGCFFYTTASSSWRSSSKIVGRESPIVFAPAGFTHGGDETREVSCRSHITFVHLSGILLHPFEFPVPVSDH